MTVEEVKEVEEVKAVFGITPDPKKLPTMYLAQEVARYDTAIKTLENMNADYKLIVNLREEREKVKEEANERAKNIQI